MLEFDDLHAVVADCGQDSPGVGRDNPNVMDLSAKPTTEDQTRIEHALDALLRPGQRVLHVGVGNSSLARRFAPIASAIDGVTLSEAEYRHALDLGLENYRVYLMNKYGPELAALEGRYDFVIDNNPASFACCVRHFEQMLASYARLLVEGGAMLTDREGMHWCYANGPFRLRFHHLQRIALSYPLEPERIDSYVYALRRRADD